MMNIKPINKWIPNLKRPLVIAGPCSAETEEQMLATAKAVREIEDVRIFRAGIWKPRTRPNSFEGVGEKGLSWLKTVKEETGLLVTTEVANAGHVELALKNDIDILWIGARTTVNPFSVQEIADALKGTNIPVMVKNPINADLALWIGALERLNLAGIDKLVAIHRGFSSAEKTEYRNVPHWRIPIELKRRLPELPIVCDPSHITGDRHRIALVCQKAMDVDMDGVMVETHPTPDEAWSDAAQQVTPTMLAEITKSLKLKTEFSHDRSFETELSELRQQIDRIDSELMESLRMRFNIVERIGDLKMKNHVTALQVHRMDEMINKVKALAENMGLRGQFANELYHVIHEESVKIQAEMMRSFLKEQEKKN
ncbi:MAG: chorismate mutase [Bdellovibrionota bacterium]|nr:chorismate mutase [Bdellovibrionota bacterium]